MDIGNYIVIDNDASLKSMKSGDGTYNYTLEGQVLLVPGAVLPVIRSGDTCIGIAKVISLVMREENTTVYFRMIDTKKSYDAVYSVYMTSEGHQGGDRGGTFGIPSRNAGNLGFKSHRITTSPFDDEDDDGPESGFTQDDIKRMFGK